MSLTDQTLPSLWDDGHAKSLSPEALLLYRSNLLGGDKRLTNFGGGNTSAKLSKIDPLSGLATDVLWVKGSGGDIGTMQLDGFSTLYMDKLLSLINLFKQVGDEDAMVGYLPHCTFNLNSRAASIDTPLHAYLPYRHVDHMHPDAVIAIAAADNSRELTEIVFKGEFGWLPWRRPGFELGLSLHQFAADNPTKRGVILEAHGLFTWGDDSKSCYENSLLSINQAQQWLDTKLADRAPFSGVKYQALAPAVRQAFVAEIMPVIRGLISEAQPMVGDFNEGAVALEFVNSNDLVALASLGTSCPDHFLRTKIKPLVLPFNPKTDNADTIKPLLDQLLKTYRADYAAYYQRCKRDNSPAMRDANPIIFLIPGVGMISFAKDKATARIAGEFYINAINVMKGAQTAGKYVGLPEQEAFDIEYWLLEEAKLQRMPKPKSLAGQIAFITGGAGGIGRATAERMLNEGAVVVLTDIDAESLATVQHELAERFGLDAVRSVLADVTDETSVIAAIKTACREYGGIDILVSNAGIASSAPVDETSLAMWERNMSILSTGYFLTSREAFKVMKQQNRGGAMVFVASKNGLVASPSASAYCTAKASEIHLARCLALEGAPLQIRVNVVNPDAVLRGSKIWTGKWKQERAEAYSMGTDELEEHYRQRSLLKRNVFPVDIANSIFFLVSDQSSKSTGNIINVDAGHAPSFTR
jgi:rhamnulose-1-phosphate aldolase/alcohol dehydrogenase